MALRWVVAAAAVLAAPLTGSATGGTPGVPGFSLSASEATPGAEVAVRVENVAGLPRRALRLYLVRSDVRQAVGSRLDRRLSFVGFVGARRQASTTFTVPPLEPGSYALAYWCRDCLPRGKALGLAAAPRLRVAAPVGEECPVTPPNGKRPPGAPALEIWNYHGNGALAALVPRNGVVVTNSAGGHKMPWVARSDLGLRFNVQYRPYGSASTPRVAQAVPGTLRGYDGPSWASRMAFEPGCWQISARLSDVSLSFVAQVERGQG